MLMADGTQLAVEFGLQTDHAKSTATRAIHVLGWRSLQAWLEMQLGFPNIRWGKAVQQ